MKNFKFKIRFIPFLCVLFFAQISQGVSAETETGDIAAIANQEAQEVLEAGEGFEQNKTNQFEETDERLKHYELLIAPIKWSPVTFDTFLNSFYVVIEAHASVFTDSSNDRTALGDSLGYGMKFGYRWGFLSAFLHAEHNMWVSSEHDFKIVDGAFNIGPGIEINYLHGYLHSSVAFGASVLLWDTVLDSAGSTGIFLDFRPLGLRWPLVDYCSINLDPLSFALIVPVLDGFPLVMMEYRTVLSTEFNF